MASWEFCVASSDSSSYEVSAYVPVDNEHEVYETEGYTRSKSSARTRHFAGQSMKMGAPPAFHLKWAISPLGAVARTA